MGKPTAFKQEHRIKIIHLKQELNISDVMSFFTGTFGDEVKRQN